MTNHSAARPVVQLTFIAGQRMRVGTTVRVIWVWVLLTAIQRNTRAGYVQEAKVRAGACKGIVENFY